MTETQNTPLITVVTVVYNDVAHIERTMLSVLNQTYPNIEYIIIDGGSTDGTVDVIKKYAERLAYWVSEPDKGVYYAMNKGIDKATGEWINFMNSGDCFYGNDIIRQIYYNKTYASDILYGDAVFDFGFIKRTKNYSSAISDILGAQKPLCHQSVFVKTSIMKRDKFDTNYKIVADHVFLISQYIKKKIFEHIAIVVSIYDTYGMSASTSLKNTRQHLMELEKIGIRQNKIKKICKFYIKKIFNPFVPTFLKRIIYSKKSL